MLAPHSSTDIKIDSRSVVHSSDVDRRGVDKDNPTTRIVEEAGSRDVTNRKITPDPRRADLAGAAARRGANCTIRPRRGPTILLTVITSLGDAWLRRLETRNDGRRETDAVIVCIVFRRIPAHSDKILFTMHAVNWYKFRFSFQRELKSFDELNAPINRISFL